MSALPPKADIRPRDQDVCFGPLADMTPGNFDVRFTPQKRTLDRSREMSAKGRHDTNLDDLAMSEVSPLPESDTEFVAC
jgi:hypothetical protein